jgi:hypothetical protein
LHIVIRSVTSGPSSGRHGRSPDEGVENVSNRHGKHGRPCAGESAENALPTDRGRCTAAAFQQQPIKDEITAVARGERELSKRPWNQETQQKRFVTLKGRWKAAKGAVCQWQPSTVLCRARCDVTDGTKWPNPLDVTLMTFNFDFVKSCIQMARPYDGHVTAIYKNRKRPPFICLFF